MKQILLLAALWTLAHSGASAGAEENSHCGGQYPTEFPCLAGGVVAQAPSIPLPQLKAFSLVTYAITAAELTAKFTEMLKAAGWQVEMHTAAEPEGNRYRMQMSRDGRTVSASIFDDGGRAMLQVMEFDKRG